MKKWKVQNIFERNEYQCQNCGNVRYGFFATLCHYRGFRDLDGVCHICLKEDFNAEVKKEYNLLKELYYVWLKYKDDNELVLQDFSFDLLKFLIKEHKGRNEWKAHYEKMLIDEYNFNFFINSGETGYVIKEFFIPYLELQRSLGEWK